MKKHILIVDDEPANRFLLEWILSDYETTSLCNVQEMLNFLKTMKVDLILLDIMMPEISGIEGAKKLSENKELSKIPVVFVSAKTTGDDVREGLEAGGVDYIKKPIDETEVLARVKKALDESQEKEKLFKDSITDSLTGLYNRNYMKHTLEQIMNTASRYHEIFALAILDIDHFKVINDTYGHLIGDEILKYVVFCMKKNLRITDIPCRYGGEEFLLILTKTEKTDAFSVMERIREYIENNPYKAQNDEEIKVTASSGLTVFRNDDNIHSLIERADKALYQAKETGRNRTVIIE